MLEFAKNNNHIYMNKYGYYFYKDMLILNS